jgi:hypothetical protein
MTRIVHKVKESVWRDKSTIRHEKCEITESTTEATSLWVEICKFFVLVSAGAVLQIVIERLIR